jgi:hypothetical protein
MPTIGVLVWLKTTGVSSLFVHKPDRFCRGGGRSIQPRVVLSPWRRRKESYYGAASGGENVMSDKPMASLEQIRLEVRLLAIENILAGLFADINRQSGVSFEQFSAAAQEMRQELRQQLVIPGPDPATSALVAAEVEQAIAALLKKIADYAGLALQTGNERPRDWDIPGSVKSWRV